MADVAKIAEPVNVPGEICNIMRRAFSNLRNGRGGPAIVEIPTDIWNEEIGDVDYTPVGVHKYGPDPADVRKAAAAILAAECPVIYSGTGVHWGEAWAELRELAELLGAPVTTSLGGKSSFPETHPLSLNSGGNALPGQVNHFINKADLIIGIGCSFTETNFGIKFPKGKKFIHATLDPNHLNKDVVSSVGLVGDAKLTLQALIGELRQTIKSNRDCKAVTAEIAAVREAWKEQWLPLINSNDAPLNPYRVIRDLHATVKDVVGLDNCIITHDAGSPRDQISPFWESTAPMTYIGWGKTTQLGMGLGLAMGAKLARPNHLCMNLWGDAAIGFTGMDFETAVRERIPILSILLNNFSMAIELKVMPISTEKYRSTDISGNYADMAKAFGGYGERVTQPDQITAAIKRGIEQTQAGTPALLEFITSKETRVSKF
jgi:acetolactate synthase-1/2/3 large subunit